MKKICSAGLLVFRLRNGHSEVFIVHNGGPFWTKKDDGFWSLPKGELHNNEDPLKAAKREFKEETSFDPPLGEYYYLGEIDYPRGHKGVSAWAVEGDFDEGLIKSNNYEIEWPPRSGKMCSFPEVDRGGWFTLTDASIKLFPANLPFLERLAEILRVDYRPQKADRQGSLF